MHFSKDFFFFIIYIFYATILLLQGYFVIATLYLMYFHCLLDVQPEDVESSPVRAPPTETPTFYTQTDDEDWAESSGDDVILNNPKGERSRPFQAFPSHFQIIFMQ